MRDCFAQATAGLPEDTLTGLSLVAVGGYGRQEMAPHSDVDVVLLHGEQAAPALVAQVAERIWYPLWDDGLSLDHAVRSAEAMLSTAGEDYRAALGMLDARPVAGDVAAVVALRSHLLSAWRRTARRRLPELQEATRERIERVGWLAHSAVMDLKEAGGGLRDGTIMRALVASWLVDVPHRELEALRTALLDVRDVLHEVTDRRTDRLSPEVVPEVAAAMDYAPDQLDLHVRDLGRRTAHLSGTTWRKLDAVLAERPSGRPRRSYAPQAPKPVGPRLNAVTAGVAILDDEVVLTGKPHPAGDPLVALSAALVAAQRRLPLATASAHRLAQGGVPDEPWPPRARRLLVELLSSGAGLVPVWEELDLAGLVDRWLPEWAPLRLKGSSSPVHRYTIDRHSVEAVVVASGLVDEVSRPDLLVVAALLHDIGKGRPGDHSEVGAPIAREVARRWGFDEGDADTIAFLVRRHLLLPTIATRRDIEDPDTALNVAQIVGDADRLELLVALTEADARATSTTAWSSWRAGLIKGLVAKTHAVLADSDALADDAYAGWPAAVPVPSGTPGTPGTPGSDPFSIEVRAHHDGSLVQIVTPDRPGLLADLAGALSLAGQQIRSARILAREGTSASMWEVVDDEIDAVRLTRRLRQVLAGEVSLEDRIGPSTDPDGVRTHVLLHPRSTTSATVVEVRGRDQRGLVWAVARAITDLGHEIRSAHVSTYGPQVRDVFYVVDAQGEALTKDETEELAARVRALPL